MLEAVVNVSEGRSHSVLEALARACGAALLDLHTDPDHHRAVFTVAGPDDAGAARAAHDLTLAAAEVLDLSQHEGVHPRFGAIDVVPFVALPGSTRAEAVAAARQFAVWCERQLGLPSFLYGDADPQGRDLPSVRRDAFRRRWPDFGGRSPHARLGAVAVGARPVLVALNLVLDAPDLDAARAIARAVRARDGGLPGVRALAFARPRHGDVQVSLNLTDLAATGVELACAAVEAEAATLGRRVVTIELVGLLPASELARCPPDLRARAGWDASVTIEGRLARPAGRGGAG